ncbi:MAG: hypothetical protein ACNS60_17355 [Candidatus Cyclobacteriaceae bacterium M2_1C_046]
MTENELRILWREEYCDPNKPIYTYDHVLVKFYENMFDHCFFESANRQKGDKSILSLNRLEKMLWIKDTLQDPTAILKKGWDKRNKSYDNSRRVAFVKGSYIVVIRFTGLLKAQFITAFEHQDEDNINKILQGPDWEQETRFYGEEGV